MVAEEFEEEVRKEGEVICEQGSEADRFFIIYQGRARVSRVHRKEEQELAVLVPGDYFGEEALYNHHKRSATVSTAETSRFFSLTRAQFDQLIKQFPKLKAGFEISIASRRLAREMRFNWLRPDEVAYFVARKHETLLLQSLSGPFVALSVPIFLLVYFFLTRSFLSIFLSGILFLVVIAWAVWNAIDWGNDYYIVTNQRAVWLEKVIGIYDSREEAPLNMVISVGVETDMTGRLLNYGNVIVRTYVGKIPFRHVTHPYQAAHVVEELWTRTKQSASRQEKEAMRNILRQKMGLTVETKVETEAPKLDKEVMPKLYRRSIFKVITDNWFKLRLEDSGIITYRKHWFVLWRQIWQPSLLIFLIVMGMFARLYTLITTPSEKLFDFTNGIRVDTVMIALPIVLLPLIGWWIYQFIDWRNDIFQVTSDQILDIDKKPFGTEERRAAPLENILSTEYHRIGLAGYLFNFGTVEITVGASKLAFEDVLDPATVQADIDNRRAARILQKREAEAIAERERMSDWLLAYHENEPELRQQEAPPEAESKSE